MRPLRVRYRQFSLQMLGEILLILPAKLLRCCCSGTSNHRASEPLPSFRGSITRGYAHVLSLV